MSRLQEQIDHIRKYRCGYCGADVGEPCRQRSSTAFEGFVRMQDFHMKRTQAAYPSDRSVANGKQGDSK